MTIPWSYGPWKKEVAAATEAEVGAMDAENWVKIIQAGRAAAGRYAGILVTVKTCLQLPEHHICVGCKKNSAHFQDALFSLLEVYAWQDWSLDFNIAGS